MNTKIIGDRGSTELIIDAERIPLPGPIDQTLVWQAKGCVVVLLETPRLLLAVDLKDKTVHTFPPPEGFGFYYLAEHPLAGVSVVCVAPSPVDGWYDWHFRINFKAGQLERFSPSK